MALGNTMKPKQSTWNYTYIYMDIYFYTYVECFSLVSYCSFVLRNIAGISKQCCGIALAFKKTFWQWPNCTNLLWVKCKSFWQGFRPNPFGKDSFCQLSFRQGFNLWVPVGSGSLPQPSTGTHIFSDQGWFSHLVMIGQTSMPSSWHSWRMYWLSSKMWPIPICWHQYPLPCGPQRFLVNFMPVKLNWTFVKSSLTCFSLSGPA